MKAAVTKPFVLDASVSFQVRCPMKKKPGMPVSLHPLSFDEAVAGLAQTKPLDLEKPRKTKKGK